MPAYAIVLIEVTDREQYSKYTQATPAVIAKFGGKFIVRGGKNVTLEGQEEKRRVVVIEFPSFERAQAFYQSEEYQQVKKLRAGAAIGTFIVADGLAMEKHQSQWPPPPVAGATLADALAVIKSKQFVDLTHAFEPGIPHWPGFPDEKRETLYWYDGEKGRMGKGFFAEQFTHVGQWGAHCDPPAHFAKDKRTIDQIDPKEMILPLVVIDVHEKAARNPDYTITMDDVRDWERRHGPIPEGAFVAMRTDWSKRWPDAKAMRNEDSKGVAHSQRKARRCRKL